MAPRRIELELSFSDLKEENVPGEELFVAVLLEETTNKFKEVNNMMIKNKILKCV